MKIIYILLLIFSIHACQKANIANTANEITEVNLPSQDTLSHETVLAALDIDIKETSGLALIEDTYWTINDSGDNPRIYRFDINSGEVNKITEISNAMNKDWESLAQDKTHMYIGDFGNNTGGRDDLRIYKIDLPKLLNGTLDSSEEINFTYPDQDKFYSGYNHNFDCEAMVSKGDSLYLFSKNWLDRKCKLYGLSKNTETQTAKLINEFDTGGTVTGASLDKEKNILYLLGYNGIGFYSSFLWVISDWQGSDFLSGTKTRYELTINRQTEGIIVDKDGSLLISAEQNKGGHPSLYRIRL